MTNSHSSALGAPIPQEEIEQIVAAIERLNEDVRFAPAEGGSECDEVRTRYGQFFVKYGRQILVLTRTFEESTQERDALKEELARVAESAQPVEPCTASGSGALPSVASGMWWSAEETLREVLRRHVQAQGSQKNAARAYGVSEQYLCDVLKRRREIGDTLASALGYRRVTAFIRVEPPIAEAREAQEPGSGPTVNDGESRRP